MRPNPLVFSLIQPVMYALTSKNSVKGVGLTLLSTCLNWLFKIQ